MGDAAPTLSLSPREREIAVAYANGASYREIAEHLIIAPSTVRTHVQMIYRKLNVSSKLELFRVLWAIDGLDRSPTGLSLPDRPSVAVLRFSNLSDDDTKSHIADGISNDIIAELSKFRELFVISRHSSFFFESGAVKARTAGKELGVRHVLQGSVQQNGDEIRITCQLIDTETDFHLWSERYRRGAADLFAAQDEIVQRVAATVSGRVRLAAIDLMAARPPADMAAYDYVLRGESIVASTKSDNILARGAFEQAIDLDPTCARGYVGLALSHIIAEFNGWNEAGDAPLKKALWYAEKAISTDNTDSRAHALLGHVYGELRDFSAAEVHLNRALELNPNDSDAYAYFGVYKEQIGQPENAIGLIRKAMRLSPFYPAWYLWKLGTSHFFSGDYENSVLALKQAVARLQKPKRARLALAAAHAKNGQIDEAKSQISQLLRYHPGSSLIEEQRLYYVWPRWASQISEGRRLTNARSELLAVPIFCVVGSQHRKLC